MANGSQISFWDLTFHRSYGPKYGENIKENMGAGEHHGG
jgi:hypothetical protein